MIMDQVGQRTEQENCLATVGTVSRYHSYTQTTHVQMHVNHSLKPSSPPPHELNHVIINVQHVTKIFQALSLRLFSVHKIKVLH